MFRSLPLLSVPLGLALLVAPAAAQAYTISQPSGNDTFGARSTGQTFTPGVGVTPDPAGQPVLLLTDVELYHGNYGPANGSATTYLKIYDADPLSGGNLVGISTNTVDTTGLSFHAPMHWSFAQLPLLTTTEYWSVMSTSNSPTSIDNAEVSLETADRTIPTPNAYAGGSGLIANIAKHPNDVDAKFQIDFFNGVLGAFAVSGQGCPSSAGQATVSAPAVPRIGQVFQVDFGNLAPTGLPVVALGFSDTVWGGNALPLPLAAVVPGSAVSCMILVSIDGAATLAPGGTTATLSLPIPNQSNFVGYAFYLQGALLEPAAVSLTAKGVAMIGN